MSSYGVPHKQPAGDISASPAAIINGPGALSPRPSLPEELSNLSPLLPLVQEGSPVLNELTPQDLHIFVHLPYDLLLHEDLFACVLKTLGS